VSYTRGSRAHVLPDGREHQAAVTANPVERWLPPQTARREDHGWRIDHRGSGRLRLSRLYLIDWRTASANAHIASSDQPYLL
jgi:hypothetical protein